MYRDSVTNIFTLTSAQEPLPLVFDSPHSGRVYPADFNHICCEDTMIRAEDNYVDDLFQNVPEYGGVLLCAEFPRTYIDVNRCESDIDPELLDGSLEEHHSPTERSYAGIGLIRRLVKPGIPLYNRQLTLDEINHRIETYYRPYHDMLEQLINDAHYKFGQVWHINCHSMPSHRAALGSIKGPVPLLNMQPDFVLGDRDGTTCEIDLTHEIRDYLKGLGYRVAINNPYKGVELVRRYSEPSRGRHSIQIEINKALYWDEENCKKSKNYNRVKQDVESLVAFLARYASGRLIDRAAD